MSAKPGKVVASFDSATVLHAGLCAALRGEPFPHLGTRAAVASALRAAGRLPWPLLKELYTRVGASEGINPDRLGDVDMADIATWLTDGIPARPYPAVLIGSSNGALTHLAAAMQVPWLPATVLVPVARHGDPDRPVDALRFGEHVARPFLKRNQDVRLHHMHDQLQDELMVARMTYFRTKWLDLPPAYDRFLRRRLTPGAPVLLVDDQSRWPVTRVAERHLFQAGAQGGRDPDYYHRQPHTPTPDVDAAESEWGLPDELHHAVAAWCRRTQHPLIRITYRGPQAIAGPVAATLRSWQRQADRDAQRLVVPSFILGDPWSTLTKGAVPFWTFFNVQAALRSLSNYLENADPYDHIDILVFQHGVRSAGIATPQEWLDLANRHAPNSQLLALDSSRFPHDIATIARYGPALRQLPGTAKPWTPLTLEEAMHGLAESPAVKVHEN